MTLGNMREQGVRNRSGRCQDWVKMKNIAHPAIERALLIALSKRRQRPR
jgi:hypothetical protein